MPPTTKRVLGRTFGPISKELAAEYHKDTMKAPAHPRMYLKDNVYEAARKRLAWLFDEFPNLVVCNSGGKDSTILTELALEIARDKGRLPLDVMFLDQELEWQETIEYMRTVMYRPDIRPHWVQVPFQLSNATSKDTAWLNAWDPSLESQWMRPKEPIGITENVYGTMRFKELFDAYAAHTWPGQKLVWLAGLRADESPGRTRGVTSQLTYGGETWGRKMTGKEHYSMYPIYDWSAVDVWKCIHEKGWKYNSIYDAQYQQGVRFREMRISALCHELALKSLWTLQEISPETYELVIKRLAGTDAVIKLGEDQMLVMKVPPMFRDWADYRDYLLPRLIQNPEWVEKMRAQFEADDEWYVNAPWFWELQRNHVQSILCNDWEFVRRANYMNKTHVLRYLMWSRIQVLRQAKEVENAIGN